MPILINDEEMKELPEEPGEAFAQLEKIARVRLEAIEESYQGEHGPPGSLYRQYMSIVIAAAETYGIRLADWDVSKIDHNNTGATYQAFIVDVDFCTTGLRLTSARRAREYSVALDAAAKIKLGRWLKQIRETVEQLDVSVAKKDRLFKCINALQAEIDRERTTFQSFGALMIEVCDDVGEATKRLEPLVRLVERIGAALGMAKRDEEVQSRLPAPRERKQIQGPKKPQKLERPLDDEIPF